MKTKIVQIHIGELTPRKAWIQTVEDFAGANNCEYKLIKTLPKDLKGLPIRSSSNHLRMRILSSEPYTFYLDTDVEMLADKIEFTDYPQIYYHVDNAMYNGSNLDLFKRVYKKMILPNGNPNLCEEIIYPAFASVVQDDWRDYSQTQIRNGDKIPEFQVWYREISDYKLYIQPDGVLLHHGLTMNK